MTISRASMQQQLKGNRMPTYRTKKGDNIKTIKPIPRTGQKLLGMKNVRKTTKKNAGGFLETFSPAYSIAKGKGPIGEAVRGGKGMGILGMLAKQAGKGKKKAGSDAMKAEGMAGADRMSGGGKMVRSKRTRSIDGIATRGKTRGSQR